MNRLTLSGTGIGIFLSLVLACATAPAQTAVAPTSVGQTQTGSVHGTVTDPTGAAIPASTVTLTSKEGASRSATANGTGGYQFSRLEPGRYTITATAPGFAPVAPREVLVFGGKATQTDIALAIQADVQQVNVNSENPGLSTSPEDNANALVIKGKALDALSDDPDELQNELSALAGPSAGPNGGQIYIDGFTGGQLPPKSSIREIRINQNPFSAQYDKLGYGRIEILTKPGTDKLHGSVMMNGNDSAFNSLNPFVTTEPAYYSTFLMANAGGSLSKKGSWFASVFRRDNQSNSIINADVLNPSGTPSNYSIAVATPQSRLDVSPRFDFQLGANNTLTVRYMFDRNIATNSGVSGFALQSQAYNTASHENTLQISDTQILSHSVVNETRFQYMRDSTNAASVSTDPTVTVQGAFTGGGNSMGVSREGQDNFEFQNLTMATKGAHSINFGGRLRLTRDSNYSTSGFNGQYIYASLNAYAAHTPAEYMVTVGTATARVNYYDLGLYFQDDHKVLPSLTLSYGLRYESQSGIGDHDDWGPRLAFAWAPGLRSGKPAHTIIRGGYGWFFDRFAETNILDTIRYNGTNQQQYILQNPGFYENAPSPTSLSAFGSAAPTLYKIAPNMRASLNMQAAIGVEHQFSRAATVSLTYLNSRGLHEFLSDNINAFDPATYNAATGSGTRPSGTNDNIYQFQSGGIYKQNEMILNYSVNAKRLMLFGFYELNFANADTSGAGYFPTNGADPAADYGRATFDIHHRFLLGGSLQGPYGISFSPMLSLDSGAPFDITIGQDLNGDNQFNDRPAWATASSTRTMASPYGTFDLAPAWNAPRIPYNLGTGPGQISMNLRLSKSFGIGPRVTGGQGGFGGGFRGGPGGGPRGGGMGGGLGPGGLSGGGPGAFMGMNGNNAPRRYSMSFSAMAHNLFNNVNLAAPNGVLESPLFGQSTALAGGFFSSGAYNRSIDLQMSFSF